MQTRSDKDIVLVVDYHSKRCQVRWFDADSGEERLIQLATAAEALSALVDQAGEVARPRGGRVVWIMESTTGWARVKALLGDRVRFLSVNVLQLPLPAKARRRKTDKLDTARLLRDYLRDDLPLAFEPDEPWRRVRRLADQREDLVHRQTALKNMINSYFAHETWHERGRFWSKRGMRHLEALIGQQPDSDALVLSLKLTELRLVLQQIVQVEQRMMQVYRQWPAAQRLDEVRGIGPIGAATIVARIGPIERFADADPLIAYAGLAPAVHESDRTSRRGSIGGGGTDAVLRHYLMEASIWARHLPRYQPTYERVARRRGNKVGRIAVARRLLRSIDAMLRHGVAFDPGVAA